MTSKRKTGIPPNFRATDTKEKYGSLRWYFEADEVPEAVNDVVDAVEALSAGFEDAEGIDLGVRLEKACGAGWRYFITEKGFRDALADPVFEVPMAVWVTARFEPFSSTTLLVSPWDGPREPSKVDVVPERPLKFVRDLTRVRTPKVISPWLLTSQPAAGSAVFAAWSEVACQRLAYVLPSEVREVDGHVKVVLKGARSTPIDEVPNGAGWADLTTAAQHNFK